MEANNTVKVIGSGRGNVKVINNKNNEVVFDDLFITYNSILITEIKIRLIETGVIVGMASEVSQAQFSTIEEI